jgi:hypothetical protein
MKPSAPESLSGHPAEQLGSSNAMEFTAIARPLQTSPYIRGIRFHEQMQLPPGTSAFRELKAEE